MKDLSEWQDLTVRGRLFQRERGREGGREGGRERERKGGRGGGGGRDALQNQVGRNQYNK